MRGLQPSRRVHAIHDVPPSPGGRYVLYWMIAARRPSWNFALDRAVDWARALGKPLLVLEALRCDYRWASDRLHRFVVGGMRDNQAAFDEAGVAYYPYLERSPREGRGLVRTLAGEAAVVVTDRAPVFDLAGLVAAASRRVATRFEEVDSNGILPLDAPPPGVVFPSAYAFRRYLQRALPEHLATRPRSKSVVKGELPLLGSFDRDLEQRWPRVDRRALERGVDLSVLPIDHSVRPVTDRGGFVAAHERLMKFVTGGLASYDEARRHPDADAGSGLSPYLHFGHISAHQVVTRVLRHERWKPAHLAQTARGTKAGWWGVSASAEAFLDQAITWRELGFNMAARRADCDRFDSLPPWAIATLERHGADPRPHRYDLEQFLQADTHDALWNAAQRQLAREGRIHNYLRMLWGKKILEWSSSPREALSIMIELNNRLALDGRDPNSYSGILWVLGRYDRPWPERPVFGVVRSMSSESTARKVHVKEYLERYGPYPPQG